MASLKNLHEPNTNLGNALHTNFDVDYVIDYRFATTSKSQAVAQFTKLIEALSDAGLATEVRNGDNGAVLVFVKAASETRLRAEVYRSRVQDWLYGVRSAAPEKDMRKSLDEEPMTEAERLRIVHLLITKPKAERGAGITPKSGEWENVESIFALHDHKFNKEWIKDLGSKYLLNSEDLTKIRDRFGEKIAFYFAFLQSYFLFLTFPAGFGFCSWVILGQYSPWYAIINGLWCIFFVEYWKKQETDLAVEWGVRGVSRIQHKRPNFRHERVIKDPVTGEEIKFYPATKRLTRQLLQVPFAIFASLVLGSLIALCFSIEVFISEVYDGPFKSYLVFLPTVLLTLIMPISSTLLTGFASKLTDFENYETTDAHEAAMVSKIFVLNFITSYLPIFLTAFVYVPFAQIIVPYLDVLQVTVRPFAEDEKQMTAPKSEFQINPDRLKKQIIYFTVTAQIVNFGMEIAVPYLSRRFSRKVKEIKADRTTNNGASGDAADDHPEEAAFLARVRNEAELSVYDVTTDLREMVVQFGYLSLFSVIWPLTAVSFLINNWIELRGDALKIAVQTQRPVPWRADSIGPWLNALGFLSWLGSLTTAAIVYLFSGDGLGPDGNPRDIKGWGLLLTIFFSEHIYLGVQLGVRTALGKIDSPGLQRERAERFTIRRQYLQDSLGQEAAEEEKAAEGVTLAKQTIGRNILEEEARQSTLQGHGTPEERFWKRQQGPSETIAIGKMYIEKAASAATEAKESKKEL
ncbi:Plasma membrane stress response protein-like protein [Venustampulla echinocandica]|uniref:Plasma membrane stress response protein-like protein n=1 Tax=Venustampulla echinocandica TaxID=2656787 RepID=A0A370TBF8_9HELO|nr:Plasma membrane stress response protein-like protein [Venustampulla echinocandica]RDL31391.1 Plasma membrane stress response protein-like protein [Venustampulla echinocandica]